ncbi:hypothetical protein KEM56_006372, partial [Ascosphaera pollenicola]
MSRDTDLRTEWSSEFSDLIIECQGEEFPVHRFIICAKSKVLSAAVKGEFKVSRRFHCWNANYTDPDGDVKILGEQNG